MKPLKRMAVIFN